MSGGEVLLQATAAVTLFAMTTTLWMAFYLLSPGFPSLITLRMVVLLLALSGFYFGSYNNIFHQIPGTAAIRAELLVIGLACWYSITFQVMSEDNRRRYRLAERGAGLLEVMAMQTNNTPLLNTAQLIESLRPVQRLRKDVGLDIRHAMNCDINGQNWTLADILLDAGIDGFSMAINHHFGGPPHPRPNVFLWQAPSGRVLPAHNGWQYSKALDFWLRK